MCKVFKFRFLGSIKTYTLDKALNDFEKHNKREDSWKYVAVATECGLHPVSYTHLDVYKRQVFINTYIIIYIYQKS